LKSGLKENKNYGINLKREPPKGGMKALCPDIQNGQLSKEKKERPTVKELIYSLNLVGK